MNRLIGITDLCKPDVASVGINYSNAVLRGGNIPVILPCTTCRDAVAQMVAKVDAILLPGGSDIDPALFNEVPSPFLGEVNSLRDEFEILVLEEAVKAMKPVFGICRGIQVINVFFGGNLYQDLFSCMATQSLQHQRPDKEWEPVHTIAIAHDSRLAEVLGCTTAEVNSTHHQAVNIVAPGFRVTATSPDGVVEAIESEQYPIWAVQFHPERLILPEGNPFVNIFASL